VIQAIAIRQLLDGEGNLSLVHKTISLRKEEWIIEEKKIHRAHNLHLDGSKSKIIEEATELTLVSFHPHQLEGQPGMTEERLGSRDDTEDQAEEDSDNFMTVLDLAAILNPEMAEEMVVLLTEEVETMLGEVAVVIEGKGVEDKTSNVDLL